MGNQGFSKIKQEQHYKRLMDNHYDNIAESRSLFDRIGSGIEKLMEIFVNHGDKFDKTFNQEEAKDFLNKFK